MEKTKKIIDGVSSYDYYWDKEDLKNLHNADKIVRDFLDNVSDYYMPSYSDFEITYGDGSKQILTYPEMKKAYELVSRIQLYGGCHIKIK